MGVIEHTKEPRAESSPGSEGMVVLDEREGREQFWEYFWDCQWDSEWDSHWEQLWEPLRKLEH